MYCAGSWLLPSARICQSAMAHGEAKVNNKQMRYRRITTTNVFSVDIPTSPA
jgi:hypothetical protein